MSQAHAGVQSSPPIRQDSGHGPNRMASRPRITYRIRLIDDSFDRASLKNALCAEFGIEINAIVVHSLALDVAYGSPSRQKVATVTFKVKPAALETGKDLIVSLPLPGEQSQELNQIVFDTTFDGFTPVTAAEQEKNTTTDCILIHGWAGHPIGSFSSPDDEDWFWPIDGLCRDMPSFRVWLYGYSSNIRDPNSIADVYNYAQTFRNSLVDSRRLSDSEIISRPIVYIVHSLGGWMLLDAINEMANSQHPDERITLEMTRGALLFGVPIDGMEIRALTNLVRQIDSSAAYTASLLDERYGSTPRVKAADEFYDTCTRVKASVYTFFETMKTPTVYFDDSADCWARDGPEELIVRKQSATYGCRARHNMINWGSNHRNMLKLRRGDASLYQILLGRLRDIERIEKDRISHAIAAENTLSESIREADELIRAYYRSSNLLSIIRLSGEELDLEECYINLALTNRSKAEEQKASFSLEARLKLDASEMGGQSIPLEKIFDPRKLNSGNTGIPRRIFIQGRAGVGKTTLCKKIVNEVVKKQIGDKLFDRLLWIPLRRLDLNSNRSEYGWYDLLQEVFSISNPKWKDLRNSYGKQFGNQQFLSKTLFLFDGLDEISREWQHNNRVYEFLNAILRDVPNVIITSRPQANTFRMDQFDLDLETIGFTTDQIGLYIRNCVLNKEKVVTMERLIAEKPLIRGLLRIPIQLDAFCYTWPDQDWAESSSEHGQESASAFSAGVSTTMTMLYQSIVTELCRKDLRKLKGLDGQLRPGSLEVRAGLRGELTILEQLAFQGMSNNIIEFTPRHWDKLVNHFYEYQSDTEPSKLFNSTLDRLSFLRTSDHREDRTKQNYHFLHLTFQEFFAARYFVKCWQGKAPMVFLDLNRRHSYETGHETKMPIAFLREEKYNPRYNIFWRFVAGLLYEKQQTAGFFKQLHSTPKDLIGFTHNRMLMYCLSEVVPDGHAETQKYYDEEIHLLHLGLIKEFKATGVIRLSHEMEFPEQILHDLLLQGQVDLPSEAILEALSHRLMVQHETLEVVADKMMSSSSAKICVLAAKILVKHSTAIPQDLLEQIIDYLFTVLKYADWSTRYDGPSELGQESLPDNVIDILLRMLRNQDSDFRSFAAIALRRCSPLNDRTIDALLIALYDEDWTVRFQTLRALDDKSLPHSAIDALLAVLEDEDEDEGGILHYDAASLLGGLTLPDVTIDTLLRACKGVGKITSWCAAVALATQLSLPSRVVDALLPELENGDNIIRRCAAEALGGDSSLPDEAIDLLLVTLKDEDEDVRRSASITLGRQDPLPDRVILALVAILEDGSSRVRWGAVLALDDCLSLPDEGVYALLAMFKDEHEGDDNRQQAIQVIRNQSVVPITILNDLLAALEDKNKKIRMSAAKALKRQSPLPENFVSVLVKLFDSKAPEIYDILHQHNLFYEGIKDLEEQDWVKIWSVWLERGREYELSCYVLDGILYLWVSGKRYKISTNREQTFRMLEAVGMLSDDTLKRKIDDASESIDDDPRHSRRRFE